MHKSQEELKRQINEAGKLVEVGGKYYHYKNPNQFYIVSSLAITEWNDEVCVVYQAQYGEKITFVRPLSTWIDQVEWQGQTVDHFTKI